MNDLKPEDVMRALECCSKSNCVDACMSGCPLWETDPCSCVEDEAALMKSALALLREKDAEIERLQGAVEQYEEERKYHFEMSRTRIAEAIDEFADALEKHFCHDPAFLGVEQRLIMDVVKQKTKELKAEKE